MSGVAGILLGLALAGCGKEPNDEGTSTVADTSTVTTEDPGATSTSTGITSLDSAEEAEVAAYAGPGSFDTTDTFPPDETTAGTDTEGTGSGTGTGTGTGTSTSTGTGTGTGTTGG